MKITLIIQDSGSGKEALTSAKQVHYSKNETETISRHITALRNLIPMLKYIQSVRTI